jgi:hypothetical protein
MRHGQYSVVGSVELVTGEVSTKTAYNKGHRFASVPSSLTRAVDMRVLLDVHPDELRPANPDASKDICSVERECTQDDRTEEVLTEEFSYRQPRV